MQKFNLEQTLEQFEALFQSGQLQKTYEKLAQFHPAEIAQILVAVSQIDRTHLWQDIDPATKGDILVNLSTELQSELLANMPITDIVLAIEQMDTDDLADIVPLIPSEALHNLLLTLDTKHRENLRQALSYDANTAGGMMNTDIITIRRNVTVKTVIRYLRLLGTLSRDMDKVFVVGPNYTYQGVVFTNALLSYDDDTLISDIISDDTISPINANLGANEVVEIFERRDLISAPVIDDNTKVIGRITIDDVVDVIRKNAEESVKKSAGITDEELFSPVLKSVKNRSLWLGINLITVLIAVFFIGLFAATMEQTIALAVLMPIVASMGGIAGTQSLILVTRGIATGSVSKFNFDKLLSKEVFLALINGIFWAFIIAFVTYLWFDNGLLSVIIGVAIVVNLLTAGLFGVTLPIILDKLRIDPALAGGVVLTTITDIVGFVAFLGLASMVM